MIRGWLVAIFQGHWEVIGGDSRWLAWSLMRKNVATMVLWAVIEVKNFREQGTIIILDKQMKERMGLHQAMLRTFWGQRVLTFLENAFLEFYSVSVSSPLHCFLCLVHWLFFSLLLVPYPFYQNKIWRSVLVDGWRITFINASLSGGKLWCLIASPFGQYTFAISAFLRSTYGARTKHVRSTYGARTEHVGKTQ